MKAISVMAFSLVAILLATIGIVSTIGSPQNSFAQNASKTGTFNHTQTDESGNPDWINTGNWSLTGIGSSSPTF